MLCYAVSVFVSVCLSAGSLEASLPWLIAGSQLRTSTTITTIITAIIIIIIITTTNILATIQLLGVLSQLQLEDSCKPNKLLMLLNTGLNFEGKVVRTSVGIQE